MNDPYVYPETHILKNLADIKDINLLAQMEADYTSSSLSDIGKLVEHNEDELAVFCKNLNI